MLVRDSASIDIAGILEKLRVSFVHVLPANPKASLTLKEFSTMSYRQPSLASLIRDMPAGDVETEASDLALVKKRPYEIRYLSAPSNAVCQAALNRNPLVIEAIHFPSPGTLKHAFNADPGLALRDAPIPSYWNDRHKVASAFCIFTPAVLERIEPGLGELVDRIRTLSSDVDERVSLLVATRHGACEVALPELDL